LPANCDAIELESTQNPAAELASSIIEPSTEVTLVPNSANNSIKISEGFFDQSEPRARGKFINGITTSGTPLPPANQPPGGPTATYTGGIGIAEGVCLSTGWITNFATPPAGRGYGIEGPNNGDNDGGQPINHEGEATRRFFLSHDLDFVNYAFPDENPKPMGADANVLEFEIEITTPGFLRLSFVLASDEYPAWVDPELFPFNDSIIILVDDQNIATVTENSEVSPFNLFTVSECGPLIFRQNDTAPYPAVLQSQGNLHKIPGEPRYDHEYGGFTKVLTRETPKALSIGTHKIKIVIQDVGTTQQGTPDPSVDSCIFIPRESLKLFEFANGDYNRNGIVDAGDFAVWNYNYTHGTSPAFFSDGDGNGNGVVDTGDYAIWQSNLGETGNRDLSADFNRDGCVDDLDFSALGTYWQLASCASRFEGDANGDGAVNDLDFSALAEQLQQGCEGESMMTGGGEGSKLDEMLARITDDKDVIAELRSTWNDAAEKAERTAVVVLAPIAKSLIPEDADANGDGQVDEADFAIIERALGITE
jgi:hypothetical protein